MIMSTLTELLPADLAGDATALCAENGRVISYVDLLARVERVRSVLDTRRRGLVLYFAERSVAGVVSHLGVLASHHAALPVDEPDDGELGYLITTFRPDVVLAPAARRGGPVGWGRYEFTGTTPGLAVLTRGRERTDEHDVHPDLALLLRTSGSLGPPKVVRLSARAVVANARAIAEVQGLRSGDRGATSAPLDFSFGLSMLHTHLSAGASMLLTRHPPSSRRFWAVSAAAGVSNVGVVPSTCRALRSSAWRPVGMPTLRLMYQAAGALDEATVIHFAETLADAGAGFAVMYGQTEATARISYLDPVSVTAHARSVGRAVPGGSIEIDDIDSNGAGEVVYRGPNVMLGYARRRSDLADGDLRRGVLRTGDLGRVLGGHLHLCGRADRMVKISGRRVHPEELELDLAAFGEVAIVASDRGLVVHAVGDTAKIESRCRALCRRWGVPHASITVVPRQRLPRTRSGKIDYGALR
jgi:acyl-coenzyme A synthetase/AMP-(fatty) acid ligase